MFRYFVFLILFLSCFLLNEAKNDLENNEDSSKLGMVFFFHRHGERSPYALYPSDPNNKIITQKIGIGQLINKGKQRLYRLGKFLRKHYTELGILPLKHSPVQQVYARSSGSVRCLQSNSLLLAGMFPPINEQEQWGTADEPIGKLWQPLPIQTAPFSTDTYLNPDYDCPSAEAELDRIYKSDEVKQMEQKHRELLDHLANVTGLNDASLSTLVYGATVYDTMLSEKNCQLQWPDWYTKDIQQQLSWMNDQVFLLNSTSRKIQRLRTGSIFNELMGHLKNYEKTMAVEDEEQIPKKLFYIYSTHDEWLSIFLSAMKVYDGAPPSFGTTVMLDVYESIENNNTKPELYIRGNYLYETETEKVVPLKFPGCSPSKGCTMQQFHDLIKDLIAQPKTLEYECVFDLKKRL